jgi:hypothetical protein
MKILLFAIPVIIMTSISCEKSHNEIDKIPDGVYTGTFQRLLAFGGGDIANVSITFSSFGWTGQSDNPGFPGLCNGTYKIEKQKIIFLNLCLWAPDFNESFILSGEFDIKINGKQLEIIRSSLGPATDGWIDKYTLTRQE